MIVRCPDCGRDVDPIPRIRGAKGWMGEHRFCPTELAPLMRCEADLVGRGVMAPPAPPPKNPRRGPSEALLLERILKYLERRGDVFGWRNNVGATKVGDRFMRFGLPGSADVLACWRGRFLAIEVKTAIGRQSDLQRKFQSNIEKHGGLYVLARSVEDVAKALGGL